MKRECYVLYMFLWYFFQRWLGMKYILKFLQQGRSKFKEDFYHFWMQYMKKVCMNCVRLVYLLFKVGHFFLLILTVIAVCAVLLVLVTLWYCATSRLLIVNIVSSFTGRSVALPHSLHLMDCEVRGSFSCISLRDQLSPTFTGETYQFIMK